MPFYLWALKCQGAAGRQVVASIIVLLLHVAFSEVRAANCDDPGRRPWASAVDHGRLDQAMASQLPGSYQRLKERKTPQLAQVST
jgi:hypothetical protein